MKFHSCAKWVKQGVSKSVPDVIDFTEEELKELIENCSEDEDASEQPVTSRQEAAPVSGDEFDFANYDNEDGAVRAKVRDIVTFGETSNKKKKKKKAKDAAKQKEQRRKPKHDDSSDSEDEKIKDDDNLILVGHVDDDCNMLDVYVYNENDQDMYVHHFMYLKSAPLCVEWLSADGVCPDDGGGGGNNNLCAVGEMDPVVGVWDLDMVNCVEPVFKLGRAKKSNSHKNYGHTDAVLALAWNVELPHILCSGSVDGRALLWDLHSGEVATELTVFGDKVQAATWNPRDPCSLLTGCADGYLRNFDCRVYDQFLKWRLNAAVECVLPYAANEYGCFAGTDDGHVHYVDYRKKKPIYTFRAHDKEVTGLGVDAGNPNVLVSVSADERVRFWDVSNECELVTSKNPKIGPLYCIDMNPNYPSLACVGGSSQSREKDILKVLNVDSILKPQEETSYAGQPSFSAAADAADSDSFDVPLLEPDAADETGPQPTPSVSTKKAKTGEKMPKKKKLKPSAKKKGELFGSKRSKMFRRKRLKITKKEKKRSA